MRELLTTIACSDLTRKSRTVIRNSLDNFDNILLVLDIGSIRLELFAPLGNVNMQPVRTCYLSYVGQALVHCCCFVAWFIAVVL